MRISGSSSERSAGDGRGINTHPKNKNLGGKIMKKGLVVILSAILVISAIAVMPAVAATDWQQFQKDTVNTGVANEKIIGCSLNWSAPTQTNQWMAAGINVVPVVANDNVYVLDVYGYIWSFNAITGAENANKSYNGPWSKNYYFQLSTPAYGNGRIYFGMSTGATCGHVYAVNANNVNTQLWAHTTNESEQIITPITYDNDKIYFGGWNGTADVTNFGTYYCLHASNGTEVWNHSVDDNGYYWAGASIIGDYIIFGDDIGNITCLNKNTGALVDEENIRDVNPNAVSIRSSVSCNVSYHNETWGRCYFTDGAVSGASLSGRVWAYDFNRTSGDLVYAWNRTLNTHSKSTPAVYNGRIYVGDGSFQANGRLYCIYESSGVIDWYYEVSDNNGQGTPGITASPIISVDGDELYIYFTTNCENARLYCINETGKLRWYYEPTEQEVEGVASGEYILQGVSVYNNSNGDTRVFFGNDNGTLYALGNGIPDLKVTKAYVNWTENAGCDCTICYEISNVGDGLAPAGHNTSLFVNNTEEELSYVNEEIAPGFSSTRCFSQTYTPVSVIGLYADCNDSVDESDESNWYVDWLSGLTNSSWECGNVDNIGAVTIFDAFAVYNRAMFTNRQLHEWAADVANHPPADINLFDAFAVYNRAMFGGSLDCWCD